MKKLTTLQRLVILLGVSGIVSHALGLTLGNEYLNFLGAFLGRSAAIMYLAALDKFRLYSLLPLIFAILNMYFGDRIFLYLELMTQGIVYQVIAYLIFTKLNEK